MPLMPRSGRPRRPRVLSSHAAKEVGRPGFRGFSQVTSQGKRAIRRLMKRDPAIGEQQPFADRITETAGVTDLSGPTPARTMSKSHMPSSGQGQKRIRDRGKNTSLDKR